jgi:hypothetical protein
MIRSKARRGAQATSGSIFRHRLSKYFAFRKKSYITRQKTAVSCFESREANVSRATAAPCTLPRPTNHVTDVTLIAGLSWAHEP